MKENKLKDLLKNMTLKEKIMQMYQIDPATYKRSTESSEEVSDIVTGPVHERILSKENLFQIGSILNCGNARNAYKIQKEYLDNSRLEIPLLFMFDIIHGFRTIFPIPLGLACSWDLSLIENTARIAAREGSKAGIKVTFAPMADLVRDPRWGRVMEGPGEDPLLNSLITAAYVRGFQGDDLTDKDSLVSCVKHFAAYGAAEGGRDYNTVDMSENTLRNFYLSGYKKGIEAGAEMVMTSFNTYDWIPVTGNKFILRKILRDDMNFEGVVISDFGAINEIIDHTAAENGVEAARKSLEAGVDIEMMSTEYINHLKDLVAEGIVAESLVDEAVMRILRLKNKLGLFEDPFRYINPEEEKGSYLLSESRELSRKSAAESMVLLKNDNILPFSKDVDSVAVIGPFADNGEIIGFWSALGKSEEAVTLKEGLNNKLGAEVEIKAVKGCDFESEDIEDIAAIENAVKKADIIILALGEHQLMSGEGASRGYLDLPGPQKKLAEKVIEAGKPTVMVLFNGRPLELKWYHQQIPAILEAWFPGTEGGNAIADILFGDINPSGKLTMSFPYTVGQVPVYYNRFTTGRPVTEETDPDARFVSKYLDIPDKAFYPFGYGLSYTSFEYSHSQLSNDELKSGETITASIKIENTGDFSGKETVQLYLRDLYGRIVRPRLELKDFRKIQLNPEESKKVKFKIKEDMLVYYDSEKGYIAEPGKFKVFIGPDSSDLKECGEFTYKKR